MRGKSHRYPKLIVMLRKPGWIVFIENKGSFAGEGLGESNGTRIGHKIFRHPFIFCLHNSSADFFSVPVVELSRKRRFKKPVSPRAPSYAKRACDNFSRPRGRGPDKIRFFEFVPDIARDYFSVGGSASLRVRLKNCMSFLNAIVKVCDSFRIRPDLPREHKTPIVFTVERNSCGNCPRSEKENKRKNGDFHVRLAMIGRACIERAYSRIILLHRFFCFCRNRVILRDERVIVVYERIVSFPIFLFFCGIRATF